MSQSPSLLEILLKASLGDWLDWPELFPYLAQDSNGALFAFREPPVLEHEETWMLRPRREYGTVYYVTEELPLAADWNATVLDRSKFIWSGGKI